GDPIPNIDITVEQSPGGIIGGSTSGGNGFFDLVNINANATYIVSIDYPGLPHDSIWTVAININDSILDSLNFYVDSTGIYILVEPLGIGATVANDPNLELELYPNPTNGPATLMIDAIKPKDIYIDITNEVGKIISTRNERVNSGVNKISLNTANLSSGIYFVKVREKGKLYVRKLIKY
ncbi:MAG: T9SS type A sorting domain-containing protein, partial [Vicingaceae bacterium]|nr:T9SS type A sorting domain-containing protein [Vicingaceae bacterium]